MKRYMFFVGTMGNGGAERVISILSRKMAESGMNVEIVTYYDREAFYTIDEKVKLTALEACTGTKNPIKNMIWFRKYLREHAKTVISFLAPFNMIALVSNFGTGIPIIVADRNDPNQIPANPIIRKLRDFLYMFSNAVVVQTEQNKAYFNRITQKKSSVIYNPVNMGDYAGIALKEEKKKKIVTAGRLMPQKNQRMMIEAFFEVSKRYPEYQLYIYGEGPLREELDALIKELKLQEKVMLPGSVSDLHEQMKNAEIFVLSSEYEGMPNALIEAMCMGLPVISTKVSGATDLVKHRENGLLTECRDKEAFADAMLFMIENKENAFQMAGKAVALNEMLATETIFDQWIRLIEKQEY